MCLTILLWHMSEPLQAQRLQWFYVHKRATGNRWSHGQPTCPLVSQRLSRVCMCGPRCDCPPCVIKSLCIMQGCQGNHIDPLRPTPMPWDIPTKHHNPTQWPMMSQHEVSEGFSAGAVMRKGWFCNNSLWTGFVTLTTFWPDALAYFRVKSFNACMYTTTQCKLQNVLMCICAH